MAADQVWRLSSLVGLMLAFAAVSADPSQKQPYVESFELHAGQSIDQRSMDNGAYYLQGVSVSGPDQCKQTCSDTKQCDLAVLEVERQVCNLVSCYYRGENVCQLVPMAGFDSYMLLGGEARYAANDTEFCLAEKVIGPCRASFPRWYYNADNQACEAFFYGGCSGNRNNYIKEDDCKQQCNGVQARGKSNEVPGVSKRMADLDTVADQFSHFLGQNDRSSENVDDKEYCTAEVKVGPCRASIPRWYYNSEQKCVQFIYGGCQGNKNNYMSEEECMNKCAASAPEPHKLKGDDQWEYKENCAAPKEVGPCRAAMPRWYFNAETHTCEQFIFGGCQGNKNNYMSEEECVERCTGHLADHANYDPLRPIFLHHSRTAMILAGLLGILAITLIAGMTCFFFKMARKNRNSSVMTVWAPADDKECLMNTAYTL